MTGQKRPSPEYISNLGERAGVWTRKSEDANKLVFEDLDAILEATMAEAYKNCHYEGFAHIERLHHYLTVTYPLKLQKELDYIKTLPVE